MDADKYPSDKFDRLRQQAQALIESKSNLDVEAPTDILGLIYELKIHQAELEIQNDELKRAQFELSDLHHQFEDLYEFAPCGYVTLNAQGVITRINLTGVTLLCAARTRLLHSGFSQYLAPGWQDTYFAALKKAGETGEKQSIEIRLNRESPPALWVRAEIQADRDASAAVSQWRIVLVDISARRKAEEDRKSLDDQLRQARKMESIGTLAGGIAHEFNNLLAIIMGNNDLAMEDVSKLNPIRTYLEEINAAGLRARDVVRQLLTFSRSDASIHTPLPIGAVVKEALKLIRSSIPKNIEIRQRIGDDVDTVLGNATQINQLIINLCSNAADAMLPGGGTLTIELDNLVLDETSAGCHQSLTSGPYVKLVIADTGCGMAKETLAHIFEPYFTTKDIGKGTGIGLAVIHGIVEKHHGVISAESKPGQGTAFTVLLPTCYGLIEDNSIEGPDLPWGTERIIVIDDEASIMQVGRRRLERLGYRVKGTTDPRHALAIFQADPYAYDLVVTDMAMPHMTGEELAIRLIRLRPALPIILCTGFSEAISEQRAHEIGISVFLMKPVNWAEFAVTVRKTLDAAKGGA